jgi:hypothetical protein
MNIIDSGPSPYHSTQQKVHIAELVYNNIIVTSEEVNSTTKTTSGERNPEAAKIHHVTVSQATTCHRLFLN